MRLDFCDVLVFALPIVVIALTYILTWRGALKCFCPCFWRPGEFCFAKRPDFLRAGIGPNVQSVYGEA
jgi:hypothetical protein